MYHLEWRARGGHGFIPEPRVQRWAAGVIECRTRPLQPVQLLEALVAHATVPRGEALDFLPDFRGRWRSPILPKPFCQCGENIDVISCGARRVQRLAHPLHSSLA